MHIHLYVYTYTHYIYIHPYVGIYKRFYLNKFCKMYNV